MGSVIAAPGMRRSLSLLVASRTLRSVRCRGSASDLRRSSGALGSGRIVAAIAAEPVGLRAGCRRCPIPRWAIASWLDTVRRWPAGRMRAVLARDFANVPQHAAAVGTRPGRRDDLGFFVALALVIFLMRFVGRSVIDGAPAGAECRARALSSVLARQELARMPKWRMRCSRTGRT